MAHPSPEAVAWIRARSPDWSRTNVWIAADLNGEMAPNPVAEAPRVAAPLSVAGIMAMVSSASRAKVYSRPSVVAFRDDLAAGNRSSAFAWVSLAHDAGDLTDAEYQAIAQAAQATVPDPAWTASIPAPIVELGRILDAEDVAAARPGAE